MVYDKTDKSYHRLILWQKFRELLLLTYKLTEKLPHSEQFGITSQMRRAAVSVISKMELEAQSEICLMLDYWNMKDYEEFDKKRSEAAYFLYRYKMNIK